MTKNLTKSKGAALDETSPPRAVHLAPQSPKRHVESDRNTASGQSDFNQGAHVVLQDEAERNARILYALQMERGWDDSREFPIDRLPTDQLQSLAVKIRDSLQNGRLGYHEVYQDHFDQGIIDAAEELDAARDANNIPSVKSIKNTLNRFYFVKSKQILDWKLKTTNESGRDIKGIIAEFSKLEADARELQMQDLVIGVNPLTTLGESQSLPESPALKFFYDGVKYYLDTEDEFVPMDQKSVSRHLRKWGCNRDTIEDAICEIQTERYINYAGALAGHPRGLHISNGSKLLATTSPKIIESSPATWATIAAVVEGLLNDPNEGTIQIDTFYSWLKVARESLVSGRRRPGQALALAGRRGCGKSLLIDLIELVLGQRRANPYAFFTGKTNFNADLAGAELLAVDDEAGTCDIRSRKKFAANIKCCLFSGAIRVEAKHRCAFTFAPVWRMVIALNDEPEALLILPPMTEDIKDKIHLFHCHQKPLPMPAHTLDEREAFFATIKSEIPAFLYWLENYEIPQGIREERCGVTFYHNPAVLSSLEELSPEGQLLSLIDTVNTAGGIGLPWEGAAAELKLILCSNESTSRDASKLLDWTPAIGTYLGRLMGERVEKITVTNGIQQWRINQVE